MNSSTVFILWIVILVIHSSTAQPYCGLLNAPDGTIYSLAHFANKTFTYSTAPWVFNEFSFVICGNLPSSCGTGECSLADSAAICANRFPHCNGKFDQATSIQALNKGQGIIITYNNGDECSDCSPPVRRATVLNLVCNSNISFGNINVTEGKDLPPLTIVNADINCALFPKNKVLQVDYYSYSSCNGTSAHKIQIQKSQFCFEGCRYIEEEYVYTTCGKPLRNVENSSWVQTIVFDDEQCNNATMQVLQKSKTCVGDFTYSYADCNADSVEFYDCKFNMYCEDCQVSNSYPTKKCAAKKQYYCLTKH